MTTLNDPKTEHFERVRAFLTSGAPFGVGVDDVETIETHIAVVFLVGDQAYKIKKPVDLGYLDFSTLEKSEEATRRELELNRRTAPDLYKGILSVNYAPGSGYALEGPGETVDWLLAMARFNNDRLLARLAETGALSIELTERMAGEIAKLHDICERKPDFDPVDGLDYVNRSNAEHIRAFAGTVFQTGDVENLVAATSAALARNAPLMRVRQGDGYVRRCHGDLHLGNAFEQDGRVVLFDCIEFNDVIGTMDVLYDLAFLLMDLSYRGLRDHAGRTMNAYFAALSAADWRAHIDGLALMPMFLAFRAAIKTHVAAQTADANPARAEAFRAQAQTYFAFAAGALRPSQARAVAIGGLSGSGKTTVARLVAPHVGAAPGALILRTDEIRKRRHGVAMTEKLRSEAYTREASDVVYAEMFEAGAAALAAGRSVVFDAVFLRQSARARAEEIARAAGAPFTGVWLDVDEAALKARVSARKGDASDADARVVDLQLAQDPGDVAWARVPATDSNAAAQTIRKEIE